MTKECLSPKAKMPIPKSQPVLDHLPQLWDFGFEISLDIGIWTLGFHTITSWGI